MPGRVSFHKVKSHLETQMPIMSRQEWTGTDDTISRVTGTASGDVTVGQTMRDCGFSNQNCGAAEPGA